MFKWLLSLLMICIAISLFADEPKGKGGFINQENVGCNVDVFAVGKLLEQPRNTEKPVRYQADSVNGLSINNLKSHAIELIVYTDPGIYLLNITNYIRADTTIDNGLILNPVRVSDIQDLKKELLHCAVIG